MKLYKSYITFSLVGLTMALCLGACSSSDEPDGSRQEEGKTVSLTIKVSDVNASTRADENPEDLTSLRVIIVDSESKVEANETFTKSTNDSYVIDGLSEGEKSLYIIGNEDAISGLGTTLSGLTAGTANANQTLESITFTGFSDKIPYSSKYDVTLEEGNNEGTYFVVPSAVKILFNFTNYRVSDVTINSINLSSVANNSYLLGHVGSKDYNKTFESKSYYWVDWLYKMNQSNDDVVDEYGWITDYELPSGTTHSPYKIDGLTIKKSSDGATPTTGLKTVYLLESKNEREGAQTYTLQFDMADGNEDSSKVLDFSNVTSLFRNTYLVVNVRLTNGGLEILADVIPWIETEVNPELGDDNKNGVVDVDPWDEGDVQYPTFGE